MVEIRLKVDIRLMIEIRLMCLFHNLYGKSPKLFQNSLILINVPWGTVSQDPSVLAEVSRTNTCALGFVDNVFAHALAEVTNK